MSIQACAELVQRGDPDRFAAAMAAPISARAVLFPLYAFNLEVARAPWVTQETMIAEMRLQWWRDALDEIAGGAQVRRHEVVTPLAEILDAEGAQVLDALVEARRWDIYRDPFEDQAHLQRYLTRTAGNLVWAAARALGAKDVARTPVRSFGRAIGVARFLQAVPALQAAGRIPLPDGRPEAVADLAGQALSDAGPKAALARILPRAARFALTEGWMARPLLARVRKDPGRVAAGTLDLSPFEKRLRLLLW